MKSGSGYMTPEGIHFTKDHPYQLVEDVQVPHLLAEGRFEQATKDDLREFYKI